MAPAQAALGQHAVDRVLDDALGVLRQRGAGGFLLQAALVAGVAGVHLLIELLAGQRDLFGVQHDHEVAHQDIGRVIGAVLAANMGGDNGGEAAQRNARRVYHDPGLNLGVNNRGVGFHRDTPMLVGDLVCCSPPGLWGKVWRVPPETTRLPQSYQTNGT